MGYFDALTSGYFKTTQDGRRLFFPWGPLGRGYFIHTQQDYERLQRQTRDLTVLTVLMPFGALALYLAFGLYPAVLILIILFGLQLIWRYSMGHGLQATGERLSLQDTLTSQAIRLDIRIILFLLIASLVFVVTGIFNIITDPDNWLNPLIDIIVFSIGTVLAAYMLVLRRRAPGVDEAARRLKR